MWCPSVSLSVWANAWLAGTAAPDDVLDALAAWAPRHSVSGRAGDGVGAVNLLQIVRSVANGPASIGIVLPVPGDVRGLAPGTAFQREALAAGEAVVVSGGTTAIGLVPEPGSSEADELCWSAYRVPMVPAAEHIDLGEAEYALRSAVRSAADTLGAIQFGYGADVADPRGLVEQVLESTRAHRAPDNAPPRALRVLENAAHVDAIITVSARLTPIGTQTASEAQIADAALRPLSAVVRSARIAAVADILSAAWRR